MRDRISFWLDSLGPAKNLLIIAWLVFVLVSIVAAALVDESSLHSPLFPLLPKLTLLCYEIMLGSAFFILSAFMIVLLVYPLRRSGKMESAQRVSGILARLMLLAGASIFIGSWAAFASVGSFLNADMLRMALQNPWLLAKHAVQLETGKIFLYTPAIIIVWAALFVWPAPQLAEKIAAARQRLLGKAALLLVAVCSALAITGNLVFGTINEIDEMSEQGLRYSAGENYRNQRDFHTGPIAGAWQSLQASLWQRTRYEIPKKFEVRRTPQISISDYMETVDRRSVKKHNVILILVESLRPDQLTCYGGERVVMPAVEALAQESLVFTQCYTQSALSADADMCAMSSQYPLRQLQITYYPRFIPYPRVMIYDILKQLDYRVGVFSSQNENWHGMANYLQTGSIDRFLHAATYDGPTYIPRHDSGFTAWAKGEKRAGKIDDRYTVKEAIEWIGEDRPQPYFIYMNLQSSHVPYELPADFPRRFGPDKIDFTLGFNNFPRDKIETVKDLYADSLAYIDFQLQKLIDRLKESGEWDNTLIVLSGDTGQAFYEHGFAAHGNALFNEVMRVPLIIRVPGVEPNVIDLPVQHVDIPPTLLHLLNLPPHPAFQGANIFSRDPHEPYSIYLFVISPLARQMALVRDGYKLIHDTLHEGYALFDLKNDPEERANLVSKHPQRTREMAERLHAWRDLQLIYYSNPPQYKKEFPPTLQEPSIQSSKSVLSVAVPGNQ